MTDEKNLIDASNFTLFSFSHLSFFKKLCKVKSKLAVCWNVWIAHSFHVVFVFRCWVQKIEVCSYLLCCNEYLCSLCCGSYYTRPLSSHHLSIPSASFGDAKDKAADGIGLARSSYFVWSTSLAYWLFSVSSLTVLLYCIR